MPASRYSTRYAVFRNIPNYQFSQSPNPKLGGYASRILGFATFWWCFSFMRKKLQLVAYRLDAQAPIIASRGPSAASSSFKVVIWSPQTSIHTFTDLRTYANFQQFCSSKRALNQIYNISINKRKERNSMARDGRKKKQEHKAAENLKQSRRQRAKVEDDDWLDDFEEDEDA